MHIKKQSTVMRTWRVPAIYRLWDDIHNCLNNYICDSLRLNGTDADPDTDHREPE